MTFELRFVVVVLAAFAWSSLLTTWLVAILWRRHRVAHPVARATSLLRLRLLPLGVGGGVAALAALAFLIFEPRGVDESTGLTLLTLAAASGTFLLAALGRVMRLVLLTRRAVRDWMRTARPVSLSGLSVPALAIDSPFPVVAVAGLFRPRLLIARTVLDACSPAELDAILAHEQGHIDRRDNLRRLVLGAVPDLLAWLPLARRIQTAWLEAAEDAADDMAAALGNEGRAVLAQALLRVARLAPGAAPVSLPASALYRGESLDRRVRRLLAPAAHAPAGGAARTWIPWGLGTVVLSLALLTLKDIHDLVEAAVVLLP